MANYFAPAFRVEVNGTRLSADVSANLEQISIVSKPDTLDTFSLTIANPYPEMRWTHTADADLFQEGNGVKIALGYVDDLHDMIDGEITTISPTFPDSGVPTIAVEGHTRLHWLQGSRNTRTFQKMTDKQIVEKIARDIGLEPEAEDPGVQYDYVMQPNRTDLEFIRLRAARIHFEVLAEGKKLIFRKMKESEEETYTLVWGHAQSLSGPNIFPLKSFNPVLNARSPVSDVSVRGYDPKNKSQIVGKAGTSDQNGSMGGSKKGGDVWSDAFRRPRQYVRVNTPVASQAEADEHARAIYNDHAIELVTGSGATIGLPALRAGKVIKLEGLGPRFNGRYYVDQATHTLDGGGYLTSFTAKRNSSS
ncbi:MAG: contractile injection system protein, VgrG/Pvc8 family [Bryobacteraceae bacterium]